MKISFCALSLLAGSFFSLSSSAQTADAPAAESKKLYIDVHQLQPGKVRFEDGATAHQKDLAVQKKHGVQFINYWVDEEHGTVYCLASSDDSNAVRNTHAEAHGLIPAYTLEVSDGEAAAITGNGQLFMDIHQLGAGKVTAAAVAEAHKKDLAVQGKHGVNFINYWVDEKAGTILCLSEAKNAESVVRAHKEAHGLVPAEIKPVKQGE